MWPWFWAVWALAGVIVETAAIAGRRVPRDTLSRNIQWLVLRPGIRRISLAGWAAFSVWFAFHIWG